MQKFWSTKSLGQQKVKGKKKMVQKNILRQFKHLRQQKIKG